ncbi:MAG: hypothetical protein MRERC_8c004 [Mycoplasmataceae bacterium RC_NB112A]|nr:MAG: hypothetical protein MRERC_11c007 [Mycoplasmataceae bacterium RC_NB112A]KLL01797.1 MAG: hypothetical protein MRERC_8c004 [Mycoplasmataceae bacterium RC_NB112A]
MEKKKITKVLIVAVITKVLLLIRWGIWMKKRANSSSNFPQKTSDNSQKKELAEKIKNGSLSFEDMSPYLFDKTKKEIFCNIEGLGFIKRNEKADIDEQDFQLILDLIKQLAPARKEREERKQQEVQKKADANPNLFYFPRVGSFAGGLVRDETDHFQFDGRQDKKTYKLIIPALHSDLNNVSISKKANDDWNVYRITGAENIPLVPHPMEHVKKWLYKIVKLADKTTIKLEN